MTSILTCVCRDKKPSVKIIIPLIYQQKTIAGKSVLMNYHIFDLILQHFTVVFNYLLLITTNGSIAPTFICNLCSYLWNINYKDKKVKLHFLCLVMWR